MSVDPASPEASSAGSSTSEPIDFVGDPGPGFNAEQAAADDSRIRHDADADARAATAEAFGLPEVAEESVRDVLRNGGDMLHAVVGVGELDWRATQADLDRIAPPATRILNRYDATRAAAAKSDELALIMGLGLYSWRSMLERRAILFAEQERTVEGTARPSSPPPPPESPGGAPESPGPGPGAPGPAPASFRVVDGYVPMADRIRQARERTPVAQPRQDPPAA